MSQASHAERRIAWQLFFLVFLTCAYFFGGGGWNQNSHFDLTRAIVERRTITIDAYLENTGDISPRAGHFFSNKAPGASLLAVPIYAMAYAAERVMGRDPSNPFVATFNAWLCTVAVSSAAAGAIAALLFLLGRAIGASASWSLAVALCTTLATPLLPYGTLFFLHEVNALWMLATIYFFVTQRPVATGSSAGIALLTNYLSVSLLGAVALLYLFRRDAKAVARFAGGAALPTLLMLLYQLSAFGALTANPVAMNNRFVQHGAALGVLGRPTLEALIGITISPYRGLIYLSPFLLFCVAALVALWRTHRELAVIVLVVSATFLTFNLCFNNWEGGFGIGPRYIVPIVPLLACALLVKPPRMRVAFAVLVAYSFLTNFAATAVDPQPSGSIAMPLERYIYPLLIKGSYPPSTLDRYPWTPLTYHGHTSVGRQHVLELTPFALFRPDSRESEWASWNGGEFLFGPGEVASVVPVLAWLIAGVLTTRRSARRADEAARQA